MASVVVCVAVTPRFQSLYTWVGSRINAANSTALATEAKPKRGQCTHHHKCGGVGGKVGVRGGGGGGGGGGGFGDGGDIGDGEDGKGDGVAL